MERWYVVQTKPGQEQLVQQELTSLGYSTFFPTFLRQKRDHAGRIIQRVMPLFSSYLFVQFDVDSRISRWRDIVHQQGVRSLLGCSDCRQTPLPHGCVEEMRQRLGDDGHVPLEPAVKQLMDLLPGMKVKINAGSFEGHIATYCKHSRNRVTLLLALLGGQVKLTLNSEILSPELSP